MLLLHSGQQLEHSCRSGVHQGRTEHKFEIGDLHKGLASLGGVLFQIAALPMVCKTKAVTGRRHSCAAAGTLSRGEAGGHEDQVHSQVPRP